MEANNKLNSARHELHKVLLVKVDVTVSTCTAGTATTHFITFISNFQTFKNLVKVDVTVQIFRLLTLLDMRLLFCL